MKDKSGYKNQEISMRKIEEKNDLLVSQNKKLSDQVKILLEQQDLLVNRLAELEKKKKIKLQNLKIELDIIKSNNEEN